MQFDNVYNWEKLRDQLDSNQPQTSTELYLHTIARALVTMAEAAELQMEVLHNQIEYAEVNEEYDDDQGGEEE